MRKKLFIRGIFVTGIMLLLPTAGTAQSLERCKALEQQCKEIAAFSKRNKEDNSDIIALCKEGVKVCKNNLKEITNDESMKDYVEFSKNLEKVVQEMDEQVGETREEILEKE